MKILFAIKSMQTKGGAERVMALVAGGLAARGHDVMVMTFDSPDSIPAYSFGPGVTHRALGVGAAGEKTSLVDALRRVWTTRRVVQTQNPDVVISFMYSSYVLTAFALVGTGTPLIGSEHIVPAYYRNRPLHFQLLLVSSLFMRRLTVVTEHIITLFPIWLRSKLVYVPNPVVLPPATLTTDPARKTLLTVGRLTTQKNHRVLIDAFARLSSAFPDWHLRIVGDGELRTELASQIMQHGLGDRVTLVPATDHIENEYAAADLFVMPSTFESFGLVTAEAMQAGLAAVGFADCPGTNEIIVHGQNGLLAAGVDDVASLTSSLSQLMGDDSLRCLYAQNAAKAVEKYQLPPVLDAWESLIMQATR